MADLRVFEKTWKVLWRRKSDRWKKKQGCQDGIPRLTWPHRHYQHSCCTVLNNFLKHSENTTKGFSVHEIVNASIKEASGSRRNEQYIEKIDANSSISGLTSRVSRTFLNSVGFIIHSVSWGWKCLDSLTALSLREPGMCPAVSHVMSCEMLNFQICTASE